MFFGDDSNYVRISNGVEPVEAIWIDNSKPVTPFGQSAPVDKDQSGSADRYEKRLKVFKEDGEPFPRLRHHGFWLLHNLVAHPILAFAPNRKTAEFHALTSQWLNHQHMADTFIMSSQIPKPKDKFWWVTHNLAAHAAIGLVPCEFTFKFHDYSAKKMNVPGWV